MMPPPIPVHRPCVGPAELAAVGRVFESRWLGMGAASAIFTSLLTTARKRGDNLLDALRAVAGPSPLHAAGMAT